MPTRLLRETGDWRHRSVSERCTLMQKSGELADNAMMSLGSRHIRNGQDTVNGCWRSSTSRMLGYSVQHGERSLKVLPVHGVDGGVVASAPVGVLMEPPLLSAHPHRRPPARSRQHGLAITRTDCTAVRSSLRDYLLHTGFPHGVYPELFATVPQINNSIADFLVHGVMLTRRACWFSCYSTSEPPIEDKIVLEPPGSDSLILYQIANFEEAIGMTAFGRMVCIG